MRLISCHIDNFGALRDFDMTFDEGLNVIMRENGWGKSTLAEFLRAMLYGYGTKRGGDERKRHTPWQGGRYGGSLIFEKDGKRYIIERYFGADSQSDETSLRGLDPAESISDIENVGEWMFGLDADAFRRCAFIDQSSIGKGNPGQSLSARLNALFGEAGGVEAYDEAQKRLSQRIRDYERPGGYIDEIKKKTDEQITKKSTAKKDMRKVSELRRETEKLGERLEQEEKSVAELKEKIKVQDAVNSERESVMKLHSQLKETVNGLDKRIDGLLKSARGSIPTLSEIQAVSQDFGEVRRVSETLKKIREQSDRKSAEIRAQYDKLVSEKEALEKDLELILAEGAIPEEEEMQVVRLGKAGIARVTDALGDLAADSEKKKAEYLEKRGELLKQRQALEERLSSMASDGTLPDEEELIRVRQSADEMSRVQETYDALMRQAEDNAGMIRVRHNALLEQQKNLENEYDTAAGGLGDDPPSLSEIRDAEGGIGRIAALKEEIDNAKENSARLESQIKAVENRYRGQMPDANETADILRTYDLLSEVEREIVENENDPVLTEAREHKARLDGFFGGSVPDEEELLRISGEVSRAQEIENDAANIEAKIAADRAKRKVYENEMSALEAADKALIFDLKKPRATAGVLCIVAAVIAVLPALIFTPIAYAVAGGLLLLGIILLVVTSKRKNKYYEKREEFEKQKHINASKMDTLRIERDLAGSGIRELQADAQEKRNEADKVYGDAVNHVMKWNPDVSKENLGEMLFLIKENLKELGSVQETLRSLEETLYRRRERSDDLNGELKAKIFVLPSDTEDLPLTERVKAADSDIANVERLRAELRECEEQVSDRSRKLAHLEASVKEVLVRCGLTTDNAAELLPTVEKKVTAAIEIGQRLEEHRERVLDFEKANAGALSGHIEFTPDSAEGRLKARIDELSADVRGVLEKYSCEDGDVAEWLEESEKRILLRESAQRELGDMDRQIADFDEANSALVNGGEPVPDSAEGKLRAQLDALREKVSAVLQKYEVLEMLADEWLEFSEQRLEDKLSLEYRIGAANKQIASFRAANSEALEGGGVSDDPAGEELQARLQALTDSISQFLKKYNIPKGAELSRNFKDAETRASEYEELCRQREAQKAQLRDFEIKHKSILDKHETDRDRADRESLKLRLMECENNRELMLRERAQAEGNIGRADEIINSYRSAVRQLKTLDAQMQEAQRALFVLKKSAESLRKAKEDMTSRYLGQIESSFNRYLSGWLADENLRGAVDENLNIAVGKNGTMRGADAYSTGYADVIDFCMRMALIDALFEEERPFIIMDDPFVDLDEQRTGHAMLLLKAMSAEKQMIYFACHPVRAKAPDSAQAGQLSVGRPREHTKREIPARKANFSLRAETAIAPKKKDRRLTSGIFPLEFIPDPALMGGEFEVFFTDEAGSVICERQRISYSGGELVPSKIRFCLNTAKASGSVYTLVVRSAAAEEQFAAKMIRYTADISDSYTI